MCSKIPYETKAQATSQAQQQKHQHKKISKKNRNAKSGSKLRPYLCCFCDKWHLTTLSKNIDRQHKRKLNNEN